MGLYNRSEVVENKHFISERYDHFQCDEKGPQCPGIQLGHPIPGGYKYGHLDLQVGRVSDERVKYGREFYRISTKE
jgi:hypothetical protein